MMVVVLTTGLVSYAQFTSKTGNPVNECDCNDPIKDLNYTVTLPSNYGKYDYIQFVLYSDGYSVSSVTLAPREINGNKVNLNILNSENQAYRSLLGREYGRYRGNDFSWASYNNLCSYKKEKTEIEVAAFGISQIGTETEYNLESDNTIRAKTVRIYDGGVEIYRGTKLPFKQNSKTGKRLNRAGYINYAVGAAAIISSVALILATDK